jgi:DNA topoisomerase I
MQQAHAEFTPQVARPPLSAATLETIASCEELRFSSDAEPGISRRRAGKGYIYTWPDGERVRDEATLERIRKLAVPPAYRNIWICRDERGHLQATGIDARGRKQYRYHAQWRCVRDAHKFQRMLAFGRALPRIHQRIARDLKLPGMPREKVLATIVRLLETTLIRVGNSEYARTNKSYGLTTLRNRHVGVAGSVVRFNFRGKHGIPHEVEIDDPRAAKVVRSCLDLPGQELFGYVGDDGQPHDIGSADVNAYLQEISGESFSAKDFRTWHATSEALETLAGIDFSTAREAKEKVKATLQQISRKLGNTPSMCRKCYINPVVIEAFLAGELRETRMRRTGNERVRLLHMLTRTPTGVGFGRAPRKHSRRAAEARLQAEARPQ